MEKCSAALSGFSSPVNFSCPSFFSLNAFAYGFNLSKTCLLRSGFFFCTAARLVFASPLTGRTTACTSELLIRRLMSALETMFEGRRKSFLRLLGEVVEP